MGAARGRRAVSGPRAGDAPRDWQRHYDPGVPATLVYDELTLPAALRRTAARHGGRAALSYFGTSISYARFLQQVDRLAAALSELGVGRDSKVAIQLPNVPQTVIAYFAVQMLGAQVVMTNPLYTDDELEHQWHDAGCTVAFVLDCAWKDRLVRMRKKLPVRHWIGCSLVDALPWPKRWFAHRRLLAQDPPRVADLSEIAGVTLWHDLLARGKPGLAPPAGPKWSDLAMLQYTGGTTGRSKAAMLTHRNLSSNVQQLRSWLPTVVEGEDVFLAVLPYFHVFGLTVCMLFPVWVGATIVLQPDPRDTRAIAENIAKHRVSVLALVPTMFRSVTTLPGVESLDLRSLKGVFSGSAPMPREVQERFEQLTGGRILEGYGLSETSPVTHINPVAGVRKTGTIGLPLPDTDARIVDAEDGRTELPVGGEGELLLAGPQVMAGYWNRPEETAQALRDGWFYTGDLAARDAEGYFRIVGRKKEMIVVGGYKVYPDEVDRVLAGHPGVLEAATIGVPDDRHGEAVKSFVVRRPGAAVGEADLMAFCREHLVPYKVPRAIEFRDELPRSTMLKVLRRELLRQELERRAELGRQERTT
jgi:long-chain acyl-CoA synthetase